MCCASTDGVGGSPAACNQFAPSFGRIRYTSIDIPRNKPARSSRVAVRVVHLFPSCSNIVSPGCCCCCSLPPLFSKLPTAFWMRGRVSIPPDSQLIYPRDNCQTCRRISRFDWQKKKKFSQGNEGRRDSTIIEIKKKTFASFSAHHLRCKLRRMKRQHITS